MKKLIAGIAAGFLLGTASMAVAATSPTVQALVSKVTFSVNGEKKPLKSDPLLYNGTTYLPVREVSEILGYGLDYNNQKKSIDFQTKGENNIMVEPSATPAVSAAPAAPATPAPAPPATTAPDLSVTLNPAEWIEWTEFYGNPANGIGFGPSSSKNIEYSISAGKGFVEFSLPKTDGESTITTNKGNIKAYKTKGKVFLWIEDLKALGLLQ